MMRLFMLFIFILFFSFVGLKGFSLDNFLLKGRIVELKRDYAIVNVNAGNCVGRKKVYFAEKSILRELKVGDSVAFLVEENICKKEFREMTSNFERGIK
ncbi:hypothetical protein FHQ18_00250 [Deferribacter autotrophicus]|uniref:DUF5666 domain-containing protein n=1 Tax=Deferribacter autotrophicus TaxID=500465 RepID=A0A5A8F701_9BACT|nr:hypothetical protein [Deferribacter autotrophicus]KAA0259343.1 hypothetical protein FHQ18_00250 [Deferribacter autotrophicus]